MKFIEEEQAFFKQLLDMLESQMNANDEIVLHDLSKEYDHTIVDIRNGHVTGRKIGDCGSNLGLEVLRGTVENGDRYNYVTHTRTGKILRSSTMFIHNEEGRVVGSICINKDITESLKMEEFLRNENKYSLSHEENTEMEHETKEVFFNNISELLEYMLQSALSHVGKQVTLMDREDKCKFLKYLDDKGVFVISKSGERVCEFLGISKFTLYNYLDSVRKANGKPEDADTPQTDEE
ncbi:MAG: helix-turn-helix transcriptional regulator [Eubacteriales bacterium]|nr:helix-turn-helix transcriptional regulator [Eubacteriales bacterium]